MILNIKEIQGKNNGYIKKNKEVRIYIIIFHASNENNNDDNGENKTRDCD